MSQKRQNLENKHLKYGKYVVQHKYGVKDNKNVTDKNIKRKLTFG